MWAQAWLTPTYLQVVRYVLAAATEASWNKRYEYAPWFNLSSQVQFDTKKWIKCVSLDTNLETGRKKYVLLENVGTGMAQTHPQVVRTSCCYRS